MKTDEDTPNVAKSKTVEILESRNEDIRNMNMSKRRTVFFKNNPNYAFDSDRRPSQPHRLSEEQIRREYGIMARQHKTLKEDVIWLLQNKGPIGIAGIKQELDLDENLRCYPIGIE